LRLPTLIPAQATVALIAPASPPSDLLALEAGIDYLASLGIRIQTARSSFKATSYLCGSDEDRATELNWFLSRPDIDAIFCARGGYGSMRIRPLIDYAAARQHPKLLIGYSDITALQLALFAKAGIPSLSGPMVGTEWSQLDPSSERMFWDLAGGAMPAPLTGPGGESLAPLKNGKAEGILIGGNLSVLTRLIGTPYLPSLKGALLFLEDVNEAPYRVDAMLAQLKLTGLWDSLGGLIIGQFTEQDSPKSTSNEILAVFRDYCKDTSFPVASGLVYGHIPVKNAMPIGVRARLEVTDPEATLSILTPLVAHDR